MFKEAFVTIIIFIILTLILSLLFRKKRQIFQSIIILLFTVCFVLNTLYNLRTFFPDFVLDNEVPLGDCSENLFLYKSDSEFPCEILFPILQNRTVYVDNCVTFYDKFFQTFAGKTESLHISEDIRSIFTSNPELFSFEATIDLIDMMDYAFPENDNYDLWYDVKLYLQTTDFTDADTLIAIIDDDNGFFLYIMTEDYYREILHSKTDENRQGV